MAKGIKAKRSKKVQGKKRTGKPTGRDTITQTTFLSEATMVGLRAMGFSKIGNVKMTDQ